jgi:hypothetical protein
MIENFKKKYLIPFKNYQMEMDTTLNFHKYLKDYLDKGGGDNRR